MSSFDELYYVCDGPFDGAQWPHYDTDKYTFGDGDYLFVQDVWCWSPQHVPAALRRIEQEEREKSSYNTGLTLTLWVAIITCPLLWGIAHALTYQPAFTSPSTTTPQSGIGKHTVGQTPIGTQPSEHTQIPSGVTSKPATPDTPEARLRQAYEYCLTDFKGTQGIVMDGSRVATASFSDPNCAKISQLWEGSQAQRQYNAELADWNRQRIAREKVLIDQVAGEGEGQQHTVPMRSRTKQ